MYSLSTYHVPDTVLGDGDTDKKTKNPLLMGNR